MPYLEEAKVGEPEVEERSKWMENVARFQEGGELPQKILEAKHTKRLAPNYMMQELVLYKRGRMYPISQSTMLRTCGSKQSTKENLLMLLWISYKGEGADLYGFMPEILLEVTEE